MSVYRYSTRIFHFLIPWHAVALAQADSFFLLTFSVPRFRETIAVDDYVLDVLMRDIVGHDRQPAAYLVYVYLYGQAARAKWRAVPASLRTLADATGLSKSAVQTALENLRRRQLVKTASEHATAVPLHKVLRHWR